MPVRHGWRCVVQPPSGLLSHPVGACRPAKSQRTPLPAAPQGLRTAGICLQQPGHAENPPATGQIRHNHRWGNQQPRTNPAVQSLRTLRPEVLDGSRSGGRNANHLYATCVHKRTAVHFRITTGPTAPALPPPTHRTRPAPPGRPGGAGRPPACRARRERPDHGRTVRGTSVRQCSSRTPRNTRPTPRKAIQVAFRHEPERSRSATANNTTDDMRPPPATGSHLGQQPPAPSSTPAGPPGKITP